MYAQIFFVTSVRGAVFTPQTFANSSLSFFGAKRPTPFFFMAAATFFPLAFIAVLPRAFFVALIDAFVAFVMVGFFVFVVVAFAFVVFVVIAMEGCKCTHALSLE